MNRRKSERPWCWHGDNCVRGQTCKFRHENKEQDQINKEGNKKVINSNNQHGSYQKFDKEKRQQKQTSQRQNEQKNERCLDLEDLLMQIRAWSQRESVNQLWKR